MHRRLEGKFAGMYVGLHAVFPHICACINLVKLFEQGNWQFKLDVLERALEYTSKH